MPTTTHQPPALPKFADVRAVLALLAEHGICICEPTLRNWIADGDFPPPINPQSGKGRRRLWRRTEVEDAIRRLAEGGE